MDFLSIAAKELSDSLLPGGAISPKMFSQTMALIVLFLNRYELSFCYE